MHWRSLEEYSPLARVLVSYMWEQRPPLLPSQFADKVGISRQTISRILNQDTLPEPSALIRMARVMQVPIRVLFTLAGYTAEEEPIYTQEESWMMVIQAVESTDLFADEEERQRLMEILLRSQQLYHSSLLPMTSPLVRSSGEDKPSGFGQEEQTEASEERDREG